MVAMNVRSYDLMPPDRRLIQLDPDSETLGKVLQRLRDEQRWTQYDLAARIDPGRVNDTQAMKNLQSLLSRYELNVMKRPDPVFLEKLETIYNLPPDTLALAALRTARQFQKRESVPENSIAIWPAEPEFIEAVRALFLLETDDLPHATRVIRTLAEGPLPRDEHAEEETG